MRAFSLRREFPDVFHKLLTPPLIPPGPLTMMTLEPEHFPYVLRQRQMTLKASGQMTVLIDPEGRRRRSPAARRFWCRPTPASNNPVDAGTPLVPGFESQDLFLATSGPQPLVLDNVEDIVLVVNYSVTLPPGLLSR